MHIPSNFQETNIDALHQLIKDYPLGTLITTRGSKIEADHLAFYFNKTDSGEVTLQTHINKANKLWKDCSQKDGALLIFHGSNAYISPNYYPSKQAIGRVVPTWNYMVVHVRGRIFFKHGGDWILQHLKNLSKTQELNQPYPWKLTDAPEEFTEKLMTGVVGLEFEVDEMVGQFKLSQDKSVEDQAGVVDGLSRSGKELDSLVAEQMRKMKIR